MWRASSRRFVQACIGLCVMVSLTACGGKGGGSGSDVGALLGYKFSEGTKTAPISLGDVQEGGVAQRAKATVGAGGNGTPANPANSFYTVAGITAGVEYVVTLANASDDVTLFLFQGDPTFTNVSANRTTDQSKISFVAPADSDVTSYFIS